MFLSKIIDICKEHILELHPNSEKIHNLTLALYREYHTYKLQKNSPELPYGRYLFYECPEKKFHIEFHVFSNNYCGSIHCHETWGIYWLLSGELFVEDFNMKDNKATLLHSKLLKKNSACNFFPPMSDWHRVRTLANIEQTMTFHIYGHGYNLEQGKYLDDHNHIVEAKRGSFKDSLLIKKYITT